MSAIQRVKACESDRRLGLFARSLSLGVSTAISPDELVESMKTADRLMYKDKAERKSQRLQSP
jgi:PleD family two-component response regulator